MEDCKKMAAFKRRCLHVAALGAKVDQYRKEGYTSSGIFNFDFGMEESNRLCSSCNWSYSDFKKVEQILHLQQEMLDLYAHQVFGEMPEKECNSQVGFDAQLDKSELPIPENSAQKQTSGSQIEVSEIASPRSGGTAARTAGGSSKYLAMDVRNNVADLINLVTSPKCDSHPLANQPPQLVDRMEDYGAHRGDDNEHQKGIVPLREKNFQQKVAKPDYNANSVDHPAVKLWKAVGRHQTGDPVTVQSDKTNGDCLWSCENTRVDGFCIKASNHNLPEDSYLASTTGDGFPPNTITYSSLVRGLCIHGNLQQSLQLLDMALECFDMMMRRNCTPNDGTYNAIAVLCEDGKVDDAFSIIQSLGSKQGFLMHEFYRNVITFLCKKGNTLAAFQLLNEMTRSGFTPDSYTISSYGGNMEYNENDFEAAMLNDTVAYCSSKISKWLLDDSCSKRAFIGFSSSMLFYDTVQWKVFDRGGYQVFDEMPQRCFIKEHPP